MPPIPLDTEAGQLSAELARRGIARGTRVRAVVQVVPNRAAAEPPMAALAEADGAFDWLAEEPDLYSDADLAPSPRPAERR